MNLFDILLVFTVEESAKIEKKTKMSEKRVDASGYKKKSKQWKSSPKKSRERVCGPIGYLKERLIRFALYKELLIRVSWEIYRNRKS